MRNYFKSATEILNLFEQAFRTLYSRGYQQASRHFKKAFLHNPYPVDVHYKLALYFVKHKEEKLFLYHLAVCYDIDSTYYEKALNEPVIKENFDIEALSVIKEEETRRTWQVMSFEEIKPQNGTFEIILKVKPKAKKNIENVYHSLPDVVRRYFNVYENDFYFGNHIKNKIILSSDAERRYCGYEKVYLAIKSFSPYVENVRFFMSSESMCWVDEINILNGIFYAYRHNTPTDYRSDKIALYERLAKKSTTDKSFHTFLSYVYLQSAESMIENSDETDLDLAKQYLQKASIHIPENSYTNYIWAKYYLQKEKISTAKKYLIKASKKTTNFEVFSTLGELALRETDYQAVIKYFTKAIQLNPQYTKLHLWRGIAQEHIGKIQYAYIDYHTEIKNMVGNHLAMTLIEYGNQVLHYNFYKSASLFYQAAIKKANLYKQELQKRELQSAEGDATGFYTNQQRQTDNTIASAYINLSLTVQKPQQKLSFCDKALQMNPAMVDAWYNKGFILQKMGKSEDAHKFYDMAIILDNNYIKAINNKFILFYTKKNYPAALDIAKKMVEIAPYYSNGWLNLGSSCFYLKKYEDAVTAYSKLVELEPNYEKGYHGLASAYAWLKKDKESIDFCKKTLAINPHLSEVISTMASGYNNLNKYDQALKYAEKVIQLNPQYYHPYYIKACVYAKRKQITKALPMIKKTLALDPSQIELLRNEKDFDNIKEQESFKKIFNVMS